MQLRNWFHITSFNRQFLLLHLLLKHQIKNAFSTSWCNISTAQSCSHKCVHERLFQVQYFQKQNEEAWKPVWFVKEIILETRGDSKFSCFDLLYMVPWGCSTGKVIPRASVRLLNHVNGQIDIWKHFTVISNMLSADTCVSSYHCRASGSFLEIHSKLSHCGSMKIFSHLLV